MERPDLIDDERTGSGPARAANVEFVQPILEGWLKALTRDEAVAKFNEAGVPCGPVYDAEDVFNDPHVEARGMLMPVADPDVGEFRLARTPLHLSACPELPAQVAPRLGEHSSEILSGLLGYDADEIAALAGDNIVQLDEGDA
jgi:crotonobetainyl-CoA:carnitine CoA-transferase CaiB-like acyl-CoA transferase